MLVRDAFEVATRFRFVFVGLFLVMALAFFAGLLFLAALDAFERALAAAANAARAFNCAGDGFFFTAVFLVADVFLAAVFALIIATYVRCPFIVNTYFGASSTSQLALLERDR